MEWVVKLKKWWKLQGRIYLAQVLLIILFVNPIARQIPAIKEFSIEPEIHFVILSAVLLIFLQLMLAIDKPTKESLKVSRLNPNSDEFLEKIKNAKQIDIAFSSTESIYIAVKETLSLKRTKVRIILRNPEVNDAMQKNKVLNYAKNWIELGNSNGSVYDVRYFDNTTLRMIILDRREVYFGFYLLQNEKLAGHQTEMMNANIGSEYGRFLVEVANNRFEAMWGNATNTPTERSKKI